MQNNWPIFENSGQDVYSSPRYPIYVAAAQAPPPHVPVSTQSMAGFVLKGTQKPASSSNSSLNSRQGQKQR